MCLKFYPTISFFFVKFIKRDLVFVSMDAIKGELSWCAKFVLILILFPFPGHNFDLLLTILSVMANLATPDLHKSTKFTEKRIHFWVFLVAV